MFPRNSQLFRVTAYPREPHHPFRLAFPELFPQHEKRLRKISYKVNNFLKEKLQFAEKLRALRDERGLSNAELAKGVGLSHVSIGNFLEGQLPKSEYLAALARFFGVSTDYLLGIEEPTEKSSIAMREQAPEYLIDDALAELDELKEKVASLERALRRLKDGKSTVPPKKTSSSK